MTTIQPTTKHQDDYMLRRMLTLPTCAALTFLSACADDTAAAVPESAMSRADVEEIVRAYIIDNPEIIVEAMQVLNERNNRKAAESLASDPRDFSVGPADAPVTIVEFFDYKCGYCRMSLDWVMEQVEKSDGQIRVVFKEFPILSDQSRTAAMAALASMDQDKYLEFHQKLMRYSGQLDREKVLELAGEVGLNTAKLEKRMDSPEIVEHLQDIRQEAQAFGADATPSFFVNGKLIQGFDKRNLEETINSALEG
ncbi:MAG: hypothetical protein CMK06_12770 [Ponticaulis sp.]|nr:hypothetical protein [Ponticaulis sp.]|tara:strand:- start:67 stop:825 length:759 start_codon:yes stop_codon:yes gene_type:complete